ncbi:MAG: hypothetical protein LBR46_00365, partial [Prevotella sp.]|nr:hypothetical protein [Prevotella sp.]
MAFLPYARIRVLYCTNNNLLKNKRYPVRHRATPSKFISFSGLLHSVRNDVHSEALSSLRGLVPKQSSLMFYFFRRTVCVSLIDNKLFDGILIRLPYVQKAGTPALHRLC